MRQVFLIVASCCSQTRMGALVAAAVEERFVLGRKAWADGPLDILPTANLAARWRGIAERLQLKDFSYG